MDGKIEDPVSYPLGYYPYIHMILVKGSSNNKASGKWLLRMWGVGNKYDVYRNKGQTSLGYTTGTAPSSSFYPTLKISEGKCKILLQCSLFYDYTGTCRETFSEGPHKGKKCGQVPARSAFGFHVISPRGVDGRKDAFFPATVIFTPKPELFSETAPQ